MLQPTAADVVTLFRRFLYLREAQSLGQNRGLRVEAIQRWSGGVAGDSWCVELLWMVLDIAYQGHPPFDRMQSVETVRSWAQDQGRVTRTAKVGDLFLYINASGRAHHIGVVTALAPLIGIAGNTSEDGSSSNGDRCAEHEITAKMFVRMPYND